MKLSVTKLDGKAAGDIELNDDVFGIDEIRADILQRCVVWQLAKRRAGTHKVQTRNENSRTGKKMYRQKGTGGARHGSRRAPQFVGGSRAFGPVVRSHETSLPKKVRALALRHALSAKAKAGQLIIAGAEVDKNFGLAARNIPHIDVLPDAGLNVYDILRADKLVLTKAAVDAVHARFSGEAKSEKEAA